MERIAHIAAQRLLTKRHEELEGQGPSRKDDDAPGSAAGGFIDEGGAVARTSESPCREDGRAGRQQRLGQKVQDVDGVFGGVAECPAAKASRCAFARSASGPEGAISKYCL